MFTFEDFDGKHVTVKATHQRYHTRFLADSEETASKIVADLNRPLLLEQLAQYRFRVETQGITVGGRTVSTDRESQAQLMGAYSSLQNEMITQTRWKGPDGFQTVDYATIQPLAQAVAAHVNNCFEAEGTIHDELDTIVDHTTMAEYDVQAQFDGLYNPEASDDTVEG